MNLAFAALMVANPSFSVLLVEEQMSFGGPFGQGIEGLVGNLSSLNDPGNELYFSQGLWLSDSRLTVAGAKQGRFGLRMGYADFGAVEYQSEVPRDEGGPLFHPYSVETMLAVGFHPDRQTAAGLGFGLVYQNQFDQSWRGTFINLGVTHRPKAMEWLRVGLYVQNLSVDRLIGTEGKLLPMKGSAALGVERGGAALALAYAKVFTYDSGRAFFSGTGSEYIVQASYRHGSFLPHARLSLGREIDPFEAGATFTFDRVALDYSVRPGLRGFDLQHFLGLKVLL